MKNIIMMTIGVISLVAAAISLLTAGYHLFWSGNDGSAALYIVFTFTEAIVGAVLIGIARAEI